MPSPRRRSPGRRLRVVLALAAATGLVPAACAAPAAGPRSERGTRRVVLLALDAADWLAIDPLVAAGRLPSFARLRQAGRTGTMLVTPPLLSPIVWTTIATGRQPEDHGVLDFMVDLPSGGQAPVAVTSRRVPAVWNLFSAGGRRVAIVGWWATWPAESVRGTIVSDRVAPQLARADATLDPRAIAPASDARRLSPALVRARDVSFEDVSGYVSLTRAEYDAALATGSGSPQRLYENRVAHLIAVIAGTRTYASMARALAAPSQPDLLAVYLEGIDTTQHLFIRDPARGPRAAEAAYRDADALLGRLAAAVAPDTWIVVCSDHGFQPADAGIASDPADLAGPAAAWHRPYGIVAAIEAGRLTGAQADAGSARDAGVVTPLDLAPTLLHAAGLPVAAEMPGRVVADLLPDDVARRPVTRAPTPQQPAASGAPSTSAVDADVQARLQALGYVGVQPSSLARQNLGEILYRRGKLDAAERELRAVVEAQPTNLAAHLWLAKTLRDAGRSRDALRVYARAVALPEGVHEGLVEAVAAAVTGHQLAEARSLMAGVKPVPADAAAIHTARAIVAQAEGKPAEAELRAALAADPLSFEALARLLDVAIAAGRPRDAVPFAKDAARRAAGSPRHLALLGEALLASKDVAEAEDALRRALALAPEGVAIRLDLSRAQMAHGRATEAVATLAAAPASPERSILLGAAEAQQAHWAEAAAAYRDALDRGDATPPLLNGLAWAELKLGRKGEAAALLDRSLALKSDQPEIGRLREEIRGGASR